MNIISIIFSISLTLFLPGLLLSYVFFRPGKIDWIERISLSFALSIAIVPLLIFYSNLIGIKIDIVFVIAEILLLLFVISVILIIKYVLIYTRAPVSFRYVKFFPTRSAKPYTNRRSVLSVHIIMKELFQSSIVTYLILLLIETIKTGFVSYFFNLNILLLVVLISGAMMVLTNYEKKKDKLLIRNWNDVIASLKHDRMESFSRAFGQWDMYYIYGVSLAGGVLVYYKTEELGYLSIIITIATSVIIFLLSYIIFTEES